MKIKKCGFLFSLVMIVCFAIPSFTSAAVVDLLEGKTGVMEKTGKEYKNMTDGNMSTFDDLLSSNFVIFDLDDVYTIDKYVVNEGKNGTNLASFYVRYYSSDHKMIKTYREISSTEKVEGVRYIGIKYDYLYAMRIFDFKVLGTTDKVTNVENLKAEVGLNEVTLSWVNPDTPKFTGVNIYQGKRLLGKLDKSKNSYVVKGLESAKEYDFTVKSIDENDFETSGETTKVLMKMPVLPPPDNVFVTPQNGKLVIAWSGVSSPYFQGYNVYVDGKEINDKPLNSSKLIVNNLENNKPYKVQISTINKNDVEGEKSKEVSEKPSSSALEVEYDVKIPFSPLDLLTSSVSLLAILGGFVLLSIAIIWFRPLKELIVKAVRREKDKK